MFLSVIGANAIWSEGQKGNSNGKSDSSCKRDIILPSPMVTIDLTSDGDVYDEGDGGADDLQQGHKLCFWGKGTLTHHVLSPDSDVLNFWAHLRKFGSLIAFVEVQGSNAEEAEEHAQILKARIDEDAYVGVDQHLSIYGAYLEGNSIIAYKRDCLISDVTRLDTGPERSLCGYNFQSVRKIGGLHERNVAVVKSPLSRGSFANMYSRILDSLFVTGFDVRVLMGNVPGFRAVRLLNELRKHISVNVITHPWSYDHRIWWMGNIGRVHYSSPVRLPQPIHFAARNHEAKQNDSETHLIQKVTVKKMDQLNNHHFQIGMYFGGNQTFRTRNARRTRNWKTYKKPKEKWESSKKKWESPKRMKRRWRSWWGNRC